MVMYGIFISFSWDNAFSIIILDSFKKDWFKQVNV